MILNRMEGYKIKCGVTIENVRIQDVLQGYKTESVGYKIMGLELEDTRRNGKKQNNARIQYRTQGYTITRGCNIEFEDTN
jgi:hypothetical protein